MSDLVLVDTDILVDVARGVAQADAFLRESAIDATLGISTITEMELIVGCRDGSELEQLQKFLASYRRVSLTPDIGERALRLMCEYRLSHGLLIPDALIAATALVSGSRLLTKNRKHYQHIPGLGLVPYPR